jgi:hypothetical protein
MLTIAILALIGMFVSMTTYIIKDNKLDVNAFLSTIAVIAWWNICTPVSISIIGIMIVLFIIVQVIDLN